MDPIYRDETVTLHHGEALATLRTMPDDSIDSCVTDPPYELKFMSKKWDNTGVAFNPETWIAVKRVLKPGAYMLAFGGTRTFHRMACAIEDAGFILQDTLCWLYGSGFPKHKSKLKPAWEPIIMAWKPDRYATPLPGLDGCRIDANGEELGGGSVSSSSDGLDRPWKHDEAAVEECKLRSKEAVAKAELLGRWPANVTLDCEAASLLDQQSGQLTSGKPMGIKAGGKLNCYSEFAGGIPVTGFGDSGGASRFFYVAKASRSERNAGCEDMEKQMLRWSSGDQSPGTFQSKGTDKAAHNHHPTVKPVDLMRWLCRLITPPGGIVLDAFMGSGTTGLAATEEKFRFIGIEREAAYYEIAKRRICAPAGPLFE